MRSNLQLMHESRNTAQQLANRTIEALYRWYVSRSQSKRNWNPDTTFDWHNVNRYHSEECVKIVEGFYAVEQFVPDYTSKLVDLLRGDYGRSQFYLRWGAEEAKHADLWRNVLLATGGRSLTCIEQYTHELRSRAWKLPFDDPLEMLFYTVLQERATQVNYQNFARLLEGRSSKPWLQQDRDPVVAHAAQTIAADEAAHFEFYLAVSQIHLYYFPEETTKALVRVLAHFEMPATQIVPNYKEFIEALYGADVFGKRKYARDVVQVVTKNLCIRDWQGLYREVNHNPLVNGMRKELAESIDRAELERAIVALFARFRNFECACGLWETRGLDVISGFEQFGGSGEHEF